MTTQEFLARNPVFNLEDAERDLNGNARKKIHRAAASGRVVSLMRGVYATVPFSSKSRKVSPDHILVMAAARPDSIMAGHTALELLGVAYSAWNTCSAYSFQRRIKFTVPPMRYIVATHPSPLVKAGATELGVVTSHRHLRSFRHLGAERCLVDGFDRPRLFGGVTELLNSIQGSFQTLNYDLLSEILSVYGRKQLYGAVGWYLERNSHHLYVPDRFLEELESKKPVSPHYLDRKVGNSFLSKRWNVLLPNEFVLSQNPDV